MAAQFWRVRLNLGSVGESVLEVEILGMPRGFADRSCSRAGAGNARFRPIADPIGPGTARPDPDAAETHRPARGRRKVAPARRRAGHPGRRHESPAGPATGGFVAADENRRGDRFRADTGRDVGGRRGAGCFRTAGSAGGRRGQARRQLHAGSREADARRLYRSYQLLSHQKREPRHRHRLQHHSLLRAEPAGQLRRVRHERPANTPLSQARGPGRSGLENPCLRRDGLQQRVGRRQLRSVEQLHAPFAPGLRPVRRRFVASLRAGGPGLELGGALQEGA